jgi:hypothetical protein
LPVNEKDRAESGLIGSFYFEIGTGDAGSSSAQLNSPVQLKWDAHHNLYVVDQKNNRIQRFDLLRSGC